MICPFCSLLCETDESIIAGCKRRDRSLVQIESRPTNMAMTPSLLEDKRKQAHELISSASRVLITGRIASVQTARSAIKLAKSLGATIDCAEAGHVFANTLAIQRVGMNTASIAEARDLADTLIVIGNDALLESFPRLPQVLSKSEHATNGSSISKRTVLLLGEFTTASIESWRAAGFETWTIATDLQSIPKLLLQWLVSANQSTSTWPVPSAINASRYTAVVWSSATIDVEQPDLWVESLLEWIALRNETSRCAGVMLSGFDGTFQQTCTWLTGYPGRIRFKSEEPHYDPIAYDYRQWIADSNHPERHSIQSDLIVLIDETDNGQLFDLNDYMGPLIAIHNGPPTDYGTLLASFVHLPCGIAGVDHPCDRFRADQTVLARIGRSHDALTTANTWIEGLVQ